MKRVIVFFISITISSLTMAQYQNINWDSFRYSGPGLKQAGWLAKRHAGEIQSSPWSVGCETPLNPWGTELSFNSVWGTDRCRIQERRFACRHALVQRPDPRR
ncbi:MAG: hypothetical protein AAGU19_19130 [Prolixibacteraceae bacterium]